ncbi:MAG: LPXTG cell wall anchor domain-containing protein, partial [Clostridia bacterium]|nr:LPXTG cell wall anchor domain-containing protein [Clostridia bacterium]
NTIAGSQKESLTRTNGQWVNLSTYDDLDDSIKDRYEYQYAHIDNTAKTQVKHVKYTTSGTDGWYYSNSNTVNNYTTGTRWSTSNTAKVYLVYKSSLKGTVTLNHYRTNGASLGSVDKAVTANINIEANGTNFGYDSTYEFVSAHIGSTTGEKVEYIKYNYDAKTWTYKTVGADEVTLAPEAPLELYVIHNVDGLIETVDTVSKGVIIDVFDYDKTAINSGHDFHFTDSSDTRSGWWNSYNGTPVGARWHIVGEELDANGYPVLTVEDKESLAYLFNPDVTHNGKHTYANANYLFQLDENGYYYYNSANNFAKLNTTPVDGQYHFDVYDSPRSSGAKYMPFNDSKDGGTDNFFHGMHTQLPFNMLEDGKLANGDKMIFEFNGDDDLWVFVDGVRLLDLGGLHQPASGRINFADGTIEIYGTNNEVRTYTSNTDYTSQRGVTINIWELFGYGTKDEWQNAWEYKEHTMDIFYLERGAGDSNCQIKFNLPPIPKQSIVVQKNLNTNDPTITPAMVQYLNSLDFSFKVIEETTENSFVAEGKKYNVVDVATGTILDTRTIESDGIITIKGGQQAVILEAYEAGSTAKYRVQEMIPVEYKAQYESATINGGKITVDRAEGEKNLVYTTGALSLANKENTVAFTNTIDWDEIKLLNITKTVVAGQDPNQQFVVNVKTGDGKTFTDIPVGTPYILKKAGETAGTQTQVTEAGKIILQDGWSVQIRVLSEVEYKVEEINLPADCTPTYTKNGTPTTEIPVAGVVKTTDETVAITNTFPIYEAPFELSKLIERNDGSENVDTEQNFNFTIKIPEKFAKSYDVIEKNGVELTDGNAEVVTFTVDNSGETPMAVATVTLKHGESIKMMLPVEALVTVVEESASGYAPKWNVEDGAFTHGDTAQAQMDTDGTAVHFTNVTGAVLPNTGGIGTGVFRIIGMTMMALAGAVIFRKRRNEA